MACFALFPRTRLYCSNCGENVGTERITNLIYSRKLGGCISLAVFLSTRSTQRQGDKRSAAADLIASHAPLRTRRHKARQNGPKHYPQGIQGAANRGPAKAQRSGFGGERRSSGTTELLPLKAKRRMWSLRRRGTPFSPIFRRATKDGATGGRCPPNAAGKNAKQNDCATGGRWFSREVGKKRATKDGATGGRCPLNAAGKNTKRLRHRRSSV